MRYSSINLAIALISFALISQVALCTLANGTSTITSYTEVTFTSTATAFVDTLGKPVKQPTSTTTARTKLNSIDVCDCNAAASSNWTQFALVLVEFWLFLKEIRDIVATPWTYGWWIWQIISMLVANKLINAVIRTWFPHLAQIPI